MERPAAPPESRTSLPRDLGDFQTPPGLVEEVLSVLGPVGIRWPRVLEPTCGRGNFIVGLLRSPAPPLEIRAYEIQENHAETARSVAKPYSSTAVDVTTADLFGVQLADDLRWAHVGPLLVIGNPPWVTNSELGTLRSANLPRKTNVKAVPGIDALTGQSNFDIAEAIWLKLIRELADQRPTIALLCKTSVARNVLQFAHDSGLPISRATIHRIDAKHWFGASVDACLFRVDVGEQESSYEATVFSALGWESQETVIAVRRDHLVADLDTYDACQFADGRCPLVWRQGVEHDAAAVMELRRLAGQLINGMQESVDIEGAHVYPLLKSSDLNGSQGRRPRLDVVITQSRLNDDTRALARTAPRLWAYLSANATVLNGRKSRIYIGRPPFSMFGIGEYSFSPYKVAISGLYKSSVFRAVGPVENRPVMLDDTCYFLPCKTASQVALIVSMLNSDICQQLIHSMVFWDAKRPITKKVLQRIDLSAVLARTERGPLMQRAQQELRHLSRPEMAQTDVWPTDLDELLVADERDDGARQYSLFA